MHAVLVWKINHTVSGIWYSKLRDEETGLLEVLLKGLKRVCQYVCMYLSIYVCHASGVEPIIDSTLTDVTMDICLD